MNKFLRLKKLFIVVTIALICCCSCDMYYQGTLGEIRYKEFRDHVVIVGCDTNSIELVIPERINNKPVTSISEKAFIFNEYLVSVVLPSSIERIEEGAFGYCTSLKKIHIPDSVEYIGQEAFQWCRQLQSIKLPENLTVIEERTFDGCDSLTSVYIHENIRQIKNYAFHDCSRLVNIHLPQNLELIGASAFCNVQNGFTVIPKNVKYVYESAFENWKNAPIVELGVDTTLWDSSVLRSIYKYYLPDSGYVVINFNNGIKVTNYIGNESTVNMPKTLLGLPILEWSSGCFKANDNISTVVFPDNLVEIPTAFFEDCNNLKQVNIPTNITTIGENAFYNCKNLNKVSLHPGVKVIERSAFAHSGCPEIIIPKETRVGQNVFSGWNENQVIKIEKGASLYNWDRWWNRDCNAQVIYDFE